MLQLSKPKVKEISSEFVEKVKLLRDQTVGEWGARGYDTLELELALNLEVGFTTTVGATATGKKKKK